MATDTPASDDPKAEKFSSRTPRIPPTLDLKAQEIASERAAPEASEQPPPAPEPGGPGPDATATAAAADAAAPDAAGTPVGDPPGPDAAAVEPGEAPKSAEQVAETTVRDEARARPGRGSAMLAALVAGIIGGGAVAGGLWYGLPKLYPPAPVAAPVAPQVDLAPLQTRIAALEARPVADPGALAALSERLERSEATLKALQETVASLKAMPAPASPAPASPAPASPAPASPAPAAPAVSAPPATPAIPPALARSVDELKTATEQGREALAALRRDVDALKTGDGALRTAVAAATTGAREAGAKVEALAPQVQALATQAKALEPQVQALTKQTQSLGPQVQALAPQVEALAPQVQALGPQVQGLAKQAETIGPRLDALNKQIEEASAAATQFNRAASGLVVVAAFRDAVVSGRPFAGELAAARATLGDRAAQLDPFATAAAEGYAPPARLAARLAQEGAAALGAAAPAPADASASLVDRLMASAESLVKVRPATGPGSVDSEGIIATAVNQVRAGQLDDALRTLKQLPESVQQRLTVTRDIEARAAAVRTAGTLFQQQLAAISGKVP